MKTMIDKKKRAGRYSSLREMTAERLSRCLDAFEMGRLSEAIGVWQQIEERDDMVRAVSAKRKKSVGRHGWVIQINDNSDTTLAEQQRKALDYFYSNLRCSHAVERSEQGGFKVLARQMMDAVGKKLAVHEVVWRREENGTNRGLVSADFRFVPLNYFENTTGELRFLETEWSAEGVGLEPGHWMVTAGEGLMVATSLAWLVKDLALKDWLSFSQKNGRPTLRGISGATRDSDEWKALEDSLEELAEGENIVHAAGDEVKVVDLGAGGSIPFPRLVERMDRMIAALWRGADLSTLSRDRGYGASLQEHETCALEEDDAEMITETLNRQIDPWIVRQVFGEGVKPVAGIKVLASPRECTPMDLQVDEFLHRIGAPLSVEATLNRYGRALPKAGEKTFIMPHRNSQKASLSESSHNSGSAAGGLHQAVQNQGPGSGPSVISRGDSPTSTHSGAVEALPNGFTRLQDDWVQLSPYGDFPHQKGLQRVDREAAEGMVRQFESLPGKMGRLFGGVPFYVGHPDLAGSHELADRKAYGWVMELAAREEGLFGRVKWSEAGEELLRNAHYKYLSPFWEAKEVGNEHGRRVFRPTALLSVGLTNMPNIPVKPLANETEGSVEKEAEAGAESAVEPRGGLALVNTTAQTANLGARKGEMLRIQNRMDRVQECMAKKMQSGLNYDQAWEQVKREHAAWFERVNGL